MGIILYDTAQCVSGAAAKERRDDETRAGAARIKLAVLYAARPLRTTVLHESDNFTYNVTVSDRYHASSFG